MKSLTIIFAAAGILATGCSPKYYTPNTQNVPLMREQGQINLNLSGNGNQAELQAAYGVINHLAVQVNGGLFIPKDHDNGNGGSGNFIEAGAGYFTPVGTSFVFEAYGLFGYGGLENHMPTSVEEYPGTTGKISANIGRYSIQPSFGYVHKYFSVAVSSRVSSLNYNRISGNLIYGGENQVDYLKDNRSMLLVEPALTVRGGLPKLKLQLQFGKSFNVSNSNFSQNNLFMTVGLNYNFSDAD